MTGVGLGEKPSYSGVRYSHAFRVQAYSACLHASSPPRRRTFCVLQQFFLGASLFFCTQAFCLHKPPALALNLLCAAAALCAHDPSALALCSALPRASLQHPIDLVDAAPASKMTHHQPFTAHRHAHAHTGMSILRLVLLDSVGRGSPSSVLLQLLLRKHMLDELRFDAISKGCVVTAPLPRSCAHGLLSGVMLSRPRRKRRGPRQLRAPQGEVRCFPVCKARLKQNSMPTGASRHAPVPPPWAFPNPCGGSAVQWCVRSLTVRGRD
eukprot:1144409-Pelagomonas_calceolata.AAC.17